MQAILDFLVEYGLFLGLVFVVVLVLIIGFWLFKKMHQRAFIQPVFHQPNIENESNQNNSTMEPEAKREGNSLKTGRVSYQSSDDDSVSSHENDDPSTTLNSDLSVPLTHSDESKSSAQKVVHSPIIPLETPESLKTPIQPLLDDVPMEPQEVDMKKIASNDDQPDENQSEIILNPSEQNELLSTKSSIEPPSKNESNSIKRQKLPPLNEEEVKSRVSTTKTTKPVVTPSKTKEVAPKASIAKKPAPPKKKAPPNFHVLYRPIDDKWYVRKEGNETIISVLETQREAISFATIKALTSDSDVIVHRKDGKIRKKATFKDVIDSETDE